MNSENSNMTLQYFITQFGLGYLWAVWKFWYYEIGKIMKESGFYCGEVRHTRLKGGAFHALRYPIFFAYLDLDELELLQQKTNYSDLWPLFSLNRPYSSFASFDEVQHLKDFPCNHSSSFKHKVQSFLSQKSDAQLTHPERYQAIRLLTHLTYFGYCFNPISIYYLFHSQQQKEVESLAATIAEVSNTPWIEMHTYPLHETIPGVTISRKVESSTQIPFLEAEWKKEFHVSPFMEMDYKYSFQFFTPQPASLKCASKMFKLSPTTANHNHELWFTASFELQKLPFTPSSILYVLVFYPLHTRWIQVLIHLEALKLFWKGVPTFNHPQGTDVDFGYGLTGERSGRVLWMVCRPLYELSAWMTSHYHSSKKEKTNTTKSN